MFKTLKNKLIDVKQKKVLKNARNQGLNVSNISDFRKFGYHYEKIENLMDDYQRSFIRINTIGGITSGIGNRTTSLTFASLDTILLAIQLYRLSQRFAILNGFNDHDPLHKDKILGIYFKSLGINAAAKAALKYHYLEAGTLADNGKASEALMLNIIIKAAKYMGKEVSSKEAGHLIPIIGGLEGAVLNYSIARKAGKSLQKAYKRAYFKTWQGQEIDN